MEILVGFCFCVNVDVDVRVLSFLVIGVLENQGVDILLGLELECL